MKKRLLFVTILALTILLGFGQSSKKIAFPIEEQSELNSDAEYISVSSRDVGDPVNISDAFFAGADFLVNAQADVTEDNAGNGSPDTDPDDGGFDWVSTVIPHSATASSTNLYGVTTLGIYYAYLNDPDASYMTAMLDAATVMIVNANIRSASDLIFLMLFQDLPGVTADIYKDAAKAKFDARIALYGSATLLAEYIRDVRHGQGYDNGIIPWDIGGWAVAAQMLEDRYSSDPYDYAVAADDIAEVIYQDSYMGNPGYFDPDVNNGWDPDYNNTDYFWYTLGITGIIDAFEYADVHTSEIAGLQTILEACQYPGGAFSYCYGANTDDEDWQSTAYAVKSLATIDQTANQTIINHACYWIAATQDGATGAWFYGSGNQYPEVGGENTTALYYGENANEVWVDDDYTESSCGGHLWGYDAFSTIQNGIDGVLATGTVNVYDGAYTENVNINKSLTLQSVNGKDVTTIQGVVAYSLGTILLPSGVNNVYIGGAGQGFHIIGIDSPSPAVEWAAIYLQGAHTNITIEDNEIEAAGDAGLMGEYNAAIDDIFITGNVFSGKTFVGPNPAGEGFSQQFTLWNVPRQLVVLGGGENPTNSLYVSFTNNQISGIAGGINTSSQEQGNTVVTIDVLEADISGNTFSGTTTRYGSSLRVRGSDTDIYENTFNSSGLGIACNHIFLGDGSAMTGATNSPTLDDVADNNTYDKAAYVSSPAGIYYIFHTLAAPVYSAPAGGTVRALAGTFIEQLYINKEGLVIDGAGEDLTTVKSPATLTLSFATPGVKKPVVFIENVATCTLSNLTIDGDGKGNANNSFVGVGFWNAGGTLNNVDVIGVRDTPFSGAQHGVGVYAYNNIPDSYAINITDVDVSDFQKNAFALSGDGLTVTMDGVYVTGAGSTSVTAQNGIQIGFGASGTVANSTVTGIHYVDNVPPVDWTATAILLYAAGTVDISSTDVTNSQTNVYFIDASGSFNSSSVTSPVDDIWANGVDIYSSAAKSNSSQDLKNAIRPFMEEHQQQSARATISVSIVNSTLTGIDYAGNYGVGAYAEGTVNMTVTNSAITGWDYAISAYEDGGAVNGVAHENDLSDNTFGYDYNGTTWQDAENNWWGHASGPLDDSDADGLENLLGNGSAVSDFVDYDPWYADEDMTFNATTEETQVYNEDQGVYYNSIQDAILGADIGDVVEVTGTHNVKNIVVNKGLKIAAGAGGAKFNGLTGSRDGTGMVINTTEDVELDGVTFENYDVAIDFEAFGSAIISNCKFINCVAAINNQTTTEIDAENNYWGHATGPMDDSPLGLYNPYGQGGIVTDYIDYQPWFTSEGLDVMPVDIAIYNPECAHLEVRVRPNIDMNGQLTTALFAVKWTDASYPDPSALINVTSGYNIDFQYYDIDGGSRYAVFGLQTNALVDWTAGNEYVIVEFDLEQDQPEGTISDFEIANDAWAYAENALYYMEFWGSDYTGYVYGSADEVYTGDCDLQLHAKVLLQGPYNTISNEMKTDLNTFIPLNQPFNVAPWNYTGTESLASIPTDMVDWVMVELRSATTTTAVRKAALLFKDGSVRSHIDSFFDVYFTDDFMPNSDYYVVITARNHMPVMSAGLVNIPNANDEYDFTDMTNYPSYGGTTAQVLLEADVHGMISGDVNKDGELIYSGTDNDRDPILAKIVDVTTQPYINGVIQGYYQEDLTMNSWVKYSGSGNDQRLIILNLIELTGTYNLNAQYASLVPGTPVKATHVNAGTGAIDIALVEKENTLEVALITKADFEYSYATNIQFTLSWNANNPMMDAITESFVSDYKLEPQGAVIETNGRKYMTFVMVEAINLPSAFNIGDHATVLSFDKGIWAGTSSKSSIANDEYTRVNNGDYYISIVGLDQTGQALDVVTGISNPVSVSGTLQLYPNPATQGFVTLSLMPAVDETLTIMVMDLSSRIVSTQQIEVSKGLPVVKQINLDGLSKGLYFITLKGNETQKTAKVEIQ